MLTDLYSIIQLLATLTIGFVILDYSDFFTKVLKTNFFNADETLKKAEDEFKSYIPDQDTRKALQPTSFSSGDTSGKIEELKRLCETTEDNIKEFKNTSTEELENAVKLRSLASHGWRIGSGKGSEPDLTEYLCSLKKRHYETISKRKTIQS